MAATTARWPALTPAPLASGAGAVVVVASGVLSVDDAGGDAEAPAPLGSVLVLPLGLGDAAEAERAAGAGEGASEERVLRTRMLSFCPAAQWPGTPQMKKRWPGLLMTILSSPEVCVAIGVELVQLW
uniref:Uncharacterized protein n=1 Tax=Zea mays TaxID=4577 RepID=C4J5L8_MAIZE|nr:unknown [Zea mays]